LNAKVDALQNLVECLHKQLAQSQETNAVQAAAIAALQKQVNQIAANPALAIGPLVTVNPNAKNGVGPEHQFFMARSFTSNSRRARTPKSYCRDFRINAG
jgi:hypothetical protein